MLLGAKKMAFLGLLLAFAVLLVGLSGILETNSLFLLAGASFCVGLSIRECGQRLGVGFYIGCTLLSLLLAPNKLYCLTFAGMGLYLVLIEFVWEKIAMMTWRKNRNIIIWLFKWLIFNAMYVPLIYWLPDLIFPVNSQNIVLIIAILVGQVGWLVYDLVYRYFQGVIWTKLRKYYFKGE